jgi:hypothetical protein
MEEVTDEIHISIKLQFTYILLLSLGCNITVSNVTSAILIETYSAFKRKASNIRPLHCLFACNRGYMHSVSVSGPSSVNAVKTHKMSGGKIHDRPIGVKGTQTR